MSVPHPGDDPNVGLYAQLNSDVLDRVPSIVSVEYVPDRIEATELRAVFDPNRLDSPSGPSPPELLVKWYRQEPHDWFRVDYTDPNTGFTPAGTRTRITRTSGGRTSSVRSPAPRIDGPSRSITRRRP